MDESPAPAHESAAIEVAVTRTGGFAGLRRHWRAAPRDPDASQWVALIEECPWADASVAAAETRHVGADRFVWLIHARCGDDIDEQAELADDQVTGAWLALIDAVRAWTDSSRG